MHTRLSTCIYVNAYTHMCMCTCMCEYICVCVCAHICVCVCVGRDAHRKGVKMEYWPEELVLSGLE